MKRISAEYHLMKKEMNYFLFIKRNLIALMIVLLSLLVEPENTCFLPLETLVKIIY